MIKLNEVHGSTCANLWFLAERQLVPPEGLRAVEVEGWGPPVRRQDLREYSGIRDKRFEPLVIVSDFRETWAFPKDVPGGSFGVFPAEWAFVCVLLPSFEGSIKAPEVVREAVPDELYLWMLFANLAVVLVVCG